MNTERKQDLIQQWGFEHHLANIYYRNIYADQGYTEQWTKEDPDYIRFIKDGNITEQYKIDWSLFN